MNIFSAKLPLTSSNITKAEVAFIDQGIEDAELLAKGIGNHVEIRLLGSDAISEITEVLNQNRHVETVHIISHGSPGCLYLGEGELSLNTLEQYSEQLQSWITASNGNLYLYGCNVAAGDAGEEFIGKLTALTGAQIHASTEKVGSPLSGGTWQFKQGDSASSEVALFSPQVKREYSHAFIPNTLDRGFGDNGRVSTDFGFNGSENANALALDANGRIIVVGRTATGGSNDDDFAIARYHVNGNLDTSFGTNGLVNLDFDNSDDIAYSVAIDSNGNILVAGSADVSGDPNDVDIAIARFTSAGVLDTTFGTEGLVRTNIVPSSGSDLITSNSRDVAFAITTDANNNILVAGAVSAPGSDESLGLRDEDAILLRYTGDGSLDTTFGVANPEGGNTGITLAAFSTGDDAALSVTTDSQGRVLIAGYAAVSDSESERNFALARFTAEGQLDTTFGGGDGIVTTDFNNTFDDIAWNVSVTESGTIRVGGFINSGDSTAQNFAIAQYTDAGELDTSFDGDGTDVTDFFNGAIFGQGVATDSLNRIIAAGDNNGDFRVVRFAEAQRPTDFNADSRADLYWVNPSTGSQAVWSVLDVNDQRESFDIQFLQTDPIQGFDLVGAFDFNSDGQTDILIRDNVNDINRVVVMNGLNQDRDNTFEFKAVNNQGQDINITNQAWRMRAAGNYDSDDDVEILWRNQETGGFALWNYNSTTGQATTDFFDIEKIRAIGAEGVLTNTAWQIQTTTDINGDGRSEILWRNTATGANAVWSFDEVGGIQSSVFTTGLTEPGSWTIVAADDYDQDGIVDIAWRNGSTGENRIWTMEFNNENQYVQASSTTILSLNSNWFAATQI